VKKEKRRSGGTKNKLGRFFLEFLYFFLAFVRMKKRCAKFALSKSLWFASGYAIIPKKISKKHLTCGKEK
jgi:hypothetical protein